MEIKLEEHTCAAEDCGITFWFTEAYGERRRSDKRSFHCPNGHGMSYNGETDKVKAIRLKNEKDALEREMNHAVNRKNAEIEELQKQLKRKCRKPRTPKL